MRFFRTIIAVLIYEYNWSWLEEGINYLCKLEMKYKREHNPSIAGPKLWENIKKIPEGMYCYSGCILCPTTVNVCPFLDTSSIARFFYGNSGCGYCHFTQEGDFNAQGVSLYWDMCKSCGIKDEIEDEELEGEPDEIPNH